MATEYRIRTVPWADHFETLRAIREQVFIREQGVPRDIEWDGQDESATHFLGLVGGEPVACARLLPDGRVGRMAVVAPYRGRGLGGALLAQIVAEARRRGFPRLYLHAQARAEDFYRQAGFTVAGAPFSEAGIPHIGMELTLESGYVTGVGYPSPFADYALALARGASRQLWILSPQLDHAVFDRGELAGALTTLARTGRQSDIRLLVGDPRPLVQRGHRLLDLARRLPSKIRLQRLAEHPQWQGQTLVLRDRDGLLCAPGDNPQRGFYEPQAPASTRQYLELFEELWRNSAADVELRGLTL